MEARVKMSKKSEEFNGIRYGYGECGVVLLAADDLIDFFKKEFVEIVYHPADKKAADLLVYMLEQFRDLYETDRFKEAALEFNIPQEGE